MHWVSMGRSEIKDIRFGTWGLGQRADTFLCFLPGIVSVSQQSGRIAQTSHSQSTLLASELAIVCDAILSIEKKKRKSASGWGWGLLYKKNLPPSWKVLLYSAFNEVAWGYDAWKCSSHPRRTNRWAWYRRQHAKIGRTERMEET